MFGEKSASGHRKKSNIWKSSGQIGKLLDSTMRKYRHWSGKKILGIVYKYPDSWGGICNNIYPVLLYISSIHPPIYVQ